MKTTLWLPLLLIPLVVLVLVGTLLTVHRLRTRSGTEPVAAAKEATSPSSGRLREADNLDTQSHLMTPVDDSAEPAPPRRNPPAAREPSPPSPQSEPINRAIDRGVAYLKTSLSGNPPAPANPRSFAAFANVANSRATALAGLALLECGVPVDDAISWMIASQVRAGARRGGRDELDARIIRPGAGSRSAASRQPRGAVPLLQITYDVSIAIWFLDRLGEADDRDLICSLALQLIAAQTANGGWTYPCPQLSEAEEQRLWKMLQEPPPSDPPAGVPPAVRFQPDKPLTFVAGNDDNSLTQFAILGLWAARKHGVPVERCLSMVEQRFRMSQQSNGCWGYVGPGVQAGPSLFGLKRVLPIMRPDSMTCAGLLGLAVGRGLGDRSRPGASAQDPAVKKALLYLAHSVGKKAPATPAAARFGLESPGRLLGARSLGDLYYLWSLERMAVVYGLPTIAGVDWYAWGSSLLLASQNDDGSWIDTYPGMVDTSFALLFLKRANVVKDLTKRLEMLGQTKDVSADEIRKGLAPVAPEGPPEK